MVSIGSHQRQSEVAGNSGNASQSAKSFSWLQHVATTWGPAGRSYGYIFHDSHKSIGYPGNHAVIYVYLHVDVCNLSRGAREIDDPEHIKWVYGFISKDMANPVIQCEWLHQVELQRMVNWSESPLKPWAAIGQGVPLRCRTALMHSSDKPALGHTPPATACRCMPLLPEFQPFVHQQYASTLQNRYVAHDNGRSSS